MDTKIKTGFKAALLMVSVCLIASAQAADTWRLSEGQEWQNVGSSQQGPYLLAVANIKQLVSQGKAGQASEAAEKLKQEFPDVAGADFDAFMKAELLFAAGKLNKAAKSYGKFLNSYPKSQLYDSAMERQFQLGTAFLGGQKITALKVFKYRGYTEGAKVMERIADRAGDKPIAKRAMLSIAKSYERRDKFFEAYQVWSDISSRWPGGDLGRDGLLGMARNLHANYRGPAYDLKDLISAKSYYQEFQSKYPRQAVELEVDRIIKQINEQIAYKQYTIGEYYEKTGSLQAANLYYQQVLDDWAGSKAAKLAEVKLSGQEE